MLEFIDFHSIRDEVLNILAKKKRRMRILGACIFSKFFGGKMKPFSPDVTYRID